MKSICHLRFFSFQLTLRLLLNLGTVTGLVWLQNEQVRSWFVASLSRELLGNVVIISVRLKSDGGMTVSVSEERQGLNESL